MELQSPPETSPGMRGCRTEGQPPGPCEVPVRRASVPGPGMLNEPSGPGAIQWRKERPLHPPALSAWAHSTENRVPLLRQTQGLNPAVHVCLVEPDSL